MRRYLPRARELSFLAALAAVCGILVCILPSRELGVMLLTFPTAVVAGIMGARRAGLLAPPPPRAVRELQEVGAES